MIFLTPEPVSWGMDEMLLCHTILLFCMVIILQLRIRMLERALEEVCSHAEHKPAEAHKQGFSDFDRIKRAKEWKRKRDSSGVNIVSS